MGLNLITRQCLGKRRIPTIEELRREVNAWCAERNQKKIAVHWHLTTEGAWNMRNRDVLDVSAV
ncbi:hypothetical protein [Schleiferilactobacillus shenzhenensis]|uniref:hypothetical protein n=1 Tax=Schleiferilactobacillus shenzhenensis TaxID=1231337 RepID=UPI003CCBAC78